ncbi:MAG: hypothetical protein AAF349_26585 [Cyanobacteria bacterium P01_A01_bin.68]
MIEDTILVRTSNSTDTRRVQSKELKVDVLTENVKIFLEQVKSILQSAPDEVGKFSFSEVTVSAEISANGKVILLGSGLETGIQGGLTFKFKRSK